MKQENNKQSLIEWLDAQAEAGLDVKLKWEGGGDSGWVYFEIDGETIENDHTSRLVDWMYDHLDYGSWAGEFSANGEAVYDPKEKAFVGTDYYSETATMSQEVNISIRMPKHLWFNQLSIHIECNYDETPQIETGFGISNGFLTSEHKQIEEYLNQNIQEKLGEAIKDWEDHEGLELESIWDDSNLLFSDFKVEGNELVGVIENIEFRYPEEDPKEIYLDLKKLLNDQD